MNDTPELVSALIALLRDPDPRVHEPVRQKLLELRSTALPALLEARPQEGDAAIRARMEAIIDCVHALQTDDRLEALARQDDASLDLERGCVLLAQLSYPELEAGQVAAALDRLADGLDGRLHGVRRGTDRVEAIRHFLFIQQGFHGHEVDWHDPDSSLIHRVLERRTGLPIALSAVTMLIGRRLGLPIFGVGMPGHYIVKYQEGDEEILFDPWSGGTVLSRQHCAELVGSWGIALHDEHLQVTDDRATLQRMCRNLIKPYWRRSDHQRLGHVVRFLHLLEEAAGPS
jgi:regulator of sirC expression with transglutaminase-like and TPR domain